jgi:hypothetical protein
LFQYKYLKRTTGIRYFIYVTTTYREWRVEDVDRQLDAWDL